jgi:hypothetical protein
MILRGKLPIPAAGSSHVRCGLDQTDAGRRRNILSRRDTGVNTSPNSPFSLVLIVKFSVKKESI